MSETVAIRTASEDETRRLGARLAAHLRGGDVLALVGELGTGKTRFVQGLAHGLGVPESTPVVSPTFTILATYREGRLTLHHFDFYRLADEKDLANIGAEEFLWSDDVCAVEWAERAPGMIPDDALWARISFEGETRVFSFSAHGDRWREVLADLAGGR